jgi:serine/threonine protein kinase
MTGEKQLEDAVYYAALQVSDDAARELFLDQACIDNPELRAAVESLLGSRDDAERLIDSAYSALAKSAGEIGDTIPESAGGAVEEDMMVGRQVGQYRILEHLGGGGCGEVYLAEQHAPVTRQVALKVIKLGMDTRSVMARFDAERQALAMMEHPNIAKVLDAGATDTGRPYFLLELVRGTRITEFCDANRFDIRQRLELFMQVCRAIQHAHQKGIIHRDIKPSNVLVETHDGVAVPKVIDFGIAKAINSSLTEETFHTHLDQLLGTPAYMSPEQAERGGLDVDTRSDVYSLGVLLYELLAGVTPFDPKELSAAGPDAMRRILLEREPPLPSAMLRTLPPETLSKTAEVRQIDPAKLISRVTGDLDWIVMRALEKDRARRYDTANGLAMDVQRHLADEAIIARPPGQLYLLGKLIRRNKVAFSAGVAVLLALVVGLGVSLWQYRKAREAERHQAELRQVAEHALANEAVLRQDAEAREMLTQSVVLLRKGDLEGAAGILDEIKEPPKRPSLDGVTALRAVGEWLALQGRWHEASRRYQWLVEIDKLDPWGPVTLDCQAGGAVFAQRGDVAAYRSFCQVAIDIQADPANGDANGRVLKTCLLLPPDKDLMARLQPIAAATEAWYAGLAPSLANSWAAIPSGLWRYRSGDFVGAIACTSSAANPPTRTLTALIPTAQLIHAMATFRSGDETDARRQLELARRAIPADFTLPVLGDGSQGYWYDWLFARVLLKEAVDLIGGSRPIR